MPLITCLTADGNRTDLEVPVGMTLMQAALAKGLPGINADCGGACQCATCHVFVEAPWTERFPAIDDTEDAMLDCTGEPRQSGSRLSCQLQIQAEHDGMVVRIPAVQ